MVYILFAGKHYFHDKLNSVIMNLRFEFHLIPSVQNLNSDIKIKFEILISGFVKSV